MSREILCQKCAFGKPEGTHEILGATWYEPAEYERVVWGAARMPAPEQRVMHVNGEPFPLPLGEYTCDLCSAAILPGQRCAARSIWTAAMNPPPAWEHEFVE